MAVFVISDIMEQNATQCVALKNVPQESVMQADFAMQIRPQITRRPLPPCSANWQ